MFSLAKITTYSINKKHDQADMIMLFSCTPAEVQLLEVVYKNIGVLYTYHILTEK